MVCGHNAPAGPPAWHRSRPAAAHPRRRPASSTASSCIARPPPARHDQRCHPALTDDVGGSPLRRQHKADARVQRLLNGIGQRAQLLLRATAGGERLARDHRLDDPTQSGSPVFVGKNSLGIGESQPKPPTQREWATMRRGESTSYRQQLAGRAQPPQLRLHTRGQPAESSQRLADDPAAAPCCRLQNTRRKSRQLSSYGDRAVGGLHSVAGELR